MNKEVAVIGGGPAGVATAVQLKRHGINPLLFEQNEIGGLIKNAWSIENYLGFPQGINGLMFVELLKKHVEKHGVDVRFEKVEHLDYEEDNERFLIQTKENVYKKNIVVVATGTKPKKLAVAEKLPETLRKKILYEIYPVLQIKNKQVMVIGAGDAAFDYALNLSKNNKVTILNRGNIVKALLLLREKVEKNSKITYHENTTIINIQKGKKRSLLINTDNGKRFEIDYLIAAVGRLPQKDFYSPELINLEKPLIDKKVLFLAGDVKNDRYRQASIAVGDGIYTAMKIHQKMKGETQ